VKLAAYLRVSTDRQADEGYGLDVQRAAIRRWAKAHGHRVTTWCADEGVSGALEALDREGLTSALGAVESGKAEGVVVARLDRLARLLTVQEATIALVWKLGGRIFTADGGEVLRDDPDDPMRTAMRQMQGVFAQLERAQVVARLRAGRRQKAEAGGYACGAPPFGHRAEDRELVADEAEQAAIKRARALRRRGRSLRAIGETLDAEGFHPRRAARWHPQGVARILDRS
jgi:DNA invertase Pin-like site-specific DNA recombinase